MSKFKIQNSKLRIKGFTLLEILVVLAILGILASISFAFLKTFSPALKLSSSIRDLTTDLRYAQQLAVTEQVNYGVHFSTTTNEYQIIRYGTTTEEILSKSLPEGITFEEINFTERKAVFNPYGAVVEMGSVILKSREKEKTIEVRPSGFVKIK